MGPVEVSRASSATDDTSRLQVTGAVWSTWPASDGVCRAPCSRFQVRLSLRPSKWQLAQEMPPADMPGVVGGVEQNRDPYVRGRTVPRLRPGIRGSPASGAHLEGRRRVCTQVSPDTSASPRGPLRPKWIGLLESMDGQLQRSTSPDPSTLAKSVWPSEKKATWFTYPMPRAARTGNRSPVPRWPDSSRLDHHHRGGS